MRTSFRSRRGLGPASIGIGLWALACSGSALGGPAFTLPETRTGFSSDPLWGIWDGPRQPGEVLFSTFTDVYVPNVVGQTARVWFDNNQGPNTRILGADWQDTDRFGDWQNIAWEEVVSTDGQRTEAHAVVVGPQPGVDGDGVYVKLGSVTFEDLQPPAVGGVQVDGPQVGGWFTGPVRVSWDASDNAALRGTTGARVDGGAGEDYGDAPDAARKVSNPLDPGHDGATTVTVWRSGPGWPTATASVPIKVDRNPPSVPTLALTSASTSAPVAVQASGSTDGAGSGLAKYEYTIDGGRSARRGSPPREAAAFSEPGFYNVQARAVDAVGHASAWSTPIAVLVTPGAGDTGNLPLPPAGVRLPDLSRVRLTRIHSDQVRRNRLVKGRPTPLATIVYGRRMALTGRFAFPNHSGLRGGFVVVRGPSGRPVTSSFTDRQGRFRVVFTPRTPGAYTVSAIGTPEVSGQVLVRMRPRLRIVPHRAKVVRHQLVVPLGPRRVLVVRGTLGPTEWAAGRSVQLQYRDGRNWLPGVNGLVGRVGRFQFRYRFYRPGRYNAVMRVVAPSERGLPYVRSVSRPFIVVLR
jgi:hypothetical protein